MDDFLDVIIIRKNRGLFNLLYFIASFLMVLLGIATATFLFQIIGQNQEMGATSVNFVSLIMFIASAGLTFLLFWSRGFMKIDYDICFTNGFVEIAKVLNNVKRVELCKFYMKEVEAGGYTTSSAYKRYESMKSIKKYKAALNADAETFFLFVKVKEKSALVIFEANQELLELMHKYNSRIVKLKK